MRAPDGVALQYEVEGGGVTVKLADGRVERLDGSAREAIKSLGGPRELAVLVLSLLLLALSLLQAPPWALGRYGFTVAVAVAGIDLALAFAAFLAATALWPRRVLVVELRGGGSRVYLIDRATRRARK